MSHARHHGDVVLPVAGLLEPADVEGLHQAREAHGVGHRPAAVGVDRQDEVGAGGPARGVDPLRVLLRGQAAHLELAARHPRLAVGLHLPPEVGEGLALHVVAADGDDGQAAPVAAEQGADAHAEGLADQVPQRAVHAGDGLQQGLAIAAGVAEREELLPDALALEEAHAHRARGERLVDHPHDVPAVLAVVAVIDLADQSLIRAHAGDHGGALEDGIRAAAEVLRQRDVDGEGLHRVDAHGRSGAGLQFGTMAARVTWLLLLYEGLVRVLANLERLPRPVKHRHPRRLGRSPSPAEVIAPECSRLAADQPARARGPVLRPAASRTPC